MATNTDDIITQDEVRAMLESRRDPTVQFRRAFQDHDATNINSGSFRFPKPHEVDGDFDPEDFAEVGEGEEYNEVSLRYDDTPISYTKYGFKFRFSDEAADDSVFDIEADQMGRQIQAQEERLDAVAYNVLAENHRGETAGDGDGTLTNEDVTEARVTLWGDGYNMNNFELYVGPDAMQDVLNQLSERSTDLGDGTIMGGETPSSNMNSGYLGTFAGVPTYATNTGDLGDGEAYLVDTGRYGYESTRWETETDVKYDWDTDETVAKIRRRLAFAAIDPGAAVRIEG